MPERGPALLARAGLDPAELMADAAREAELADYGDLGFLEPMRRWLLAAVTEGRLTTAGVASLQGIVRRLLVNRLRLASDLSRHPEILREVVDDPIVIIGVGRSGTTKLQRVHSSDPSVQSLLFWRLLNPAPFPGQEPGEPDLRIAAAEEHLRLVSGLAPDLSAVHSTAACEPDEDAFLQEFTFESFAGVGRVSSPSYVEWWSGRPLTAVYDYELLLLQHLQWQDGGARGRPWILKAPIHLGNLEEVARVFPAATIVHCHRDPRSTIPSYARLLELYRRQLTDDLDPVAVGQEVLRFWSTEMDKYLSYLDERHRGAPIIDVRYEEIRTDVQGVVRAVWASRGREVDDGMLRRIEEWDHEHPQHAAGAFEYPLERFGLSVEAIDAAFGPYRDRFITPTDRGR